MKEEINKIRELLCQKIFWKIQGLNLFLVLRKIVYFILIGLSLIFVVSLTSQALHFSKVQREGILSLIVMLVGAVSFLGLCKKVFHGGKFALEAIKTTLNACLWFFLICLAFSIQLTDYKKISELLQSLLMVAFLFGVSRFFIFRNLVHGIRTGKKADWVRRVDWQKKSNCQDGLLLLTEVLEIYYLKYSRVEVSFTTKHRKK